MLTIVIVLTLDVLIIRPYLYYAPKNSQICLILYTNAWDIVWEIFCTPFAHMFISIITRQLGLTLQYFVVHIPVLLISQ